MGTSIRIGVELVKSISGTDPQCAGLFLEEGTDKAAADTGRVFGLMLVNGKLVAIILVQSVISGKPHKAFFVPQNSTHMALGKTIARCKSFKFMGRVLRLNFRRK